MSRHHRVGESADLISLRLEPTFSKKSAQSGHSRDRNSWSIYGLSSCRSAGEAHVGMQLPKKRCVICSANESGTARCLTAMKQVPRISTGLPLSRESLRQRSQKDLTFPTITNLSIHPTRVPAARMIAGSPMTYPIL
jgi:hypothetical protein